MAAALLAFSGCIKEKEMAQQVPQMTITVSMPDDAVTKVAFSVPGSEIGLHLAWQADDQIRVISGSNSAVYDIQPGFTDHTATFTGPVVAGEKFDIVCPATFASVEEAQVGNVNLTQDGNGSTSHLVFTAKLGNVDKDDLGSIGFTDEWVASHAGTTLNMGGIVKLVLTLPGAVNAPKKVVLSGLGDDDIAVNITGVSLTSEHVLTAYAQSSWEDIPISTGTEFTVSVTNNDESVFTATKTIPADATLRAGTQNIVKVTGGFIEQDFAGGNGTQASPYLIGNAKQLDNMHKDGILKHQERVYFRLIADIDMGPYIDGTMDQSWEPLNWKSPYDYIIDFDGNNHTISNFKSVRSDMTEGDWSHEKYDKPSFFGLLYGSCYNVTFTNATIETESGTCGVLGGYIGYNGKKAVVYNVHVKNSTITRTSSSGDSGIGGFAGRIGFAYIDSSSAQDVTVNSTNKDYAGVLFGLDWNESCRVRNCWTSGVVHGSQKVGGICGGLVKAESAIINCFSTATVDGMRYSGGIAGGAVMDSGTVADYGTMQPENVFQGCIAWQSSFATRDVRTPYVDAWGSGAIVGITATHNYLVNCKRNPSLDTHWTEVNGVTPYDQEDASPTTELVIDNPNSGVMKHYFPYHGKAFSGTLSDAARACGWDEDVWDLSGSIPVLTGAVEATPPEETPTSGDSNIPNVSTTSRAFPANNSTSQGLTWTVTEVRPGIRYYHGYGIPTDTWWGDTYSTSAADQYQEIFVADLDLSKTDYDVKVVVTSAAVPTSTVFSQMGAIVAINGGYEKASIAVKGNSYLDTSSGKRTDYATGYPYSYMPNNTISNTGVPNWKSEGAFYSDGHQGVRIAFDAYGGSATGKTSTNGTITKGPREMRRYYRECTDEYAGFISSAPILDANYVRFGMSFYSRAASGTNSESPRVHQGKCYPRTAVGIAYPNGDAGAPHMLLIVNDGRYPKSTERGFGMNAYQLERVIANFFGPKYLLNLDGGGSTTMCVEGQGDATTHVVNYPWDNYDSDKKVDHAGERARDSFIVIVPAE